MSDLSVGPLNTLRHSTVVSDQPKPNSSAYQRVLNWFNPLPYLPSIPKSEGSSKESIFFNRLAVENQRRKESGQEPLDRNKVVIQLSDNKFYGRVLKSLDKYEVISAESRDTFLLIRLQKEAEINGQLCGHGYITQDEVNGFVGIITPYPLSGENVQEELISGDSRESVEKEIARRRIDSQIKSLSIGSLEVQMASWCRVNNHFYAYHEKDGEKKQLLGPYLSEAEMNFEIKFSSGDTIADADVRSALDDAVKSGRAPLDVRVSVGNSISYGFVTVESECRVISSKPGADSSSISLREEQVKWMIENNQCDQKKIVEILNSLTGKIQYYAIDSKGIIHVAESKEDLLVKAGMVKKPLGLRDLVAVGIINRSNAAISNDLSEIPPLVQRPNPHLLELKAQEANTIASPSP